MRKRTNFSENQKAEIYARDGATCAFSGISLWLFDHGVRNGYDMDWADHIKPSARGGTSCLDNGICASSTFNAKKRDNGSDNIFFFHHSRITPDYFDVFGPASDELLADLDRRSRLTAADWYLNRSIANVFIAFDWRCRRDIYGQVRKRTDVYWMSSAHKRFQKWKRRRPDATLSERGVLPVNRPFGSDSMLAIEHVDTEEQFQDWAETLWPAYRLSRLASHQFFSTACPDEKRRVVDEFAERTDVHPDVAKGLSQLCHTDTESIVSRAA